MAETAKITVTVDYNEESGGGTKTVEGTVQDVNGAELSGEGNAKGSSSRSVEQNDEGGTDKIESDNPLKKGQTFTKARVTIERSCGAQGKISLMGEGNVSASGSLDGNCIVLVTRNRTMDGDRIIIKEKTRRKCCPPAPAVQKAAFDDRGLGEAAVVLAQAFGDLQLRDVAELITKRKIERQLFERQPVAFHEV